MLSKRASVGGRHERRPSNSRFVETSGMTGAGRGAVLPSVAIASRVLCAALTFDAVWREPRQRTSSGTGDA